jgi:hypothetical protein
MPTNVSIAGAIDRLEQDAPALGRAAIILLGGDNAGDWSGWYERNVPVADDLYDR